LADANNNWRLLWRKNYDSKEKLKHDSREFLDLMTFFIVFGENINKTMTIPCLR
tara:strand:+ start:27 stop:188 length:162 start_codon:yes stop_codon:yes gene_type:complete